MKTKLYRKFVKMFCASHKITRHQLFSRQFDECLMWPYVFNMTTRKLERDESKLFVLNHRKPLSMTWECCDFHTIWLFKYWKYSHWKSYISMKLDLGFKLNSILIEVLNAKKDKI